MLFPTLTFGLFFCCVFAAHLVLLRHPAPRKLLLLSASYLFYGAWDWRFCFLLLASSVVNYIAGNWLRDADSPGRKRWILIGCIAINLIVLGFFQYYGFFVESRAELLFQIGWQRDLLFLDVILPVGISFFTFQGISYAVDTYRNKIPQRPGAVDVLLYISFFPQLVAGPIVRAAHFLPQLAARAPTRIAATFGMVLISWGLFKKVVVATYLAEQIVDPVFFDPLGYGTLDVLAAVYAYAFQIYCDFSAYSDIAIGVAALLGFEFPRNFDQPYRAASLREFWRRWHISLSTWLRDYLYIPMGGGRGGPRRTYRNLFLTMLLGGLWHGAAWKFVAWGALHGAGLGIERAVRAANWGVVARVPVWLRIVLIFQFVCVGWILFRAESFALAMDVFAALGQTDLELMLLSPFVVGLMLLGAIMQFTPGRTLQMVERGCARLPLSVQGALFGFVVVLIDALGVEGVAPFIYFQF